MDTSIRQRAAATGLASILIGAGVVMFAVGPVAAESPSRTYSVDADFNEGASNNVATIPADQLQLAETVTAFPFIWIALSDRGTIAKIDTVTGAVLGEYSTTSDGDNASNPSRTTVGLDGSVWAGNRNQSSVVHVGVLEAGQCVDRNGNGTIETSSGYGNVLAWPGGSSGNSAPVTEALDECILHYVDTTGRDARHVSIDTAGDVWVGSTSRDFQKIAAATGTIVPGSARAHSCGGYGGLVDGNGVLWSTNGSSTMLRWDPNAADEAGVNPRCIAIPAYGLARDSQNNIWVSRCCSTPEVRKVSPDGNTVQVFPTGAGSPQGLAVDSRDHVWLSSNLFAGANQIAHLKNDGSLVGVVTGAGSGSTGISIDAAGKIWTANIASSDATRIDPAAGPIGLDGITPVGAFDLTVPLPGANPYNYSDMTGSALTGKPQAGSWAVVYDGGVADAVWQKLSWTSDVSGDGSLVVTAASSGDGVTFGDPVTATNGGALSLPNGRYLRITVVFTRSTTGVSPILYDLTVNTPPAPPTTTEAPTTVAPTTVAPTTVAPTTVAPTTAAPTTAAPVTVVPTTFVIGQLPETGSTSGSQLTTALAFVLIGGGLILLARQRGARQL